MLAGLFAYFVWPTPYAVEPLTGVVRNEAESVKNRLEAARILDKAGSSLEPSVRLWCVLASGDFEQAAAFGTDAANTLMELIKAGEDSDNAYEALLKTADYRAVKPLFAYVKELELKIKKRA